MNSSLMVIEAHDSQFMGQFLTDLPDRVILNKVTTGSGMTSLALSNEVKYVICVPFKNLIINKALWCRERNIDMLGVYTQSEGGATDEQLSAFKGNKIMVTWDSLHRVVKSLGERIGEWKILIDESHKLIDSGAFRYLAIEEVLNTYTKFKSYVFGTATPVKDEHQLPCLRSIQKAVIRWDNLLPVSIHYTRYDEKINEAAAVLAMGYIKGSEKGNAHIFLNSVKSITSIIRHIVKGGGTMADIRVICAPNDRNLAIGNHKLESLNFKIDSINSPVKKVNFYTATCFEGCDILDEEGRTYIIVDGSKNHTKVDILTTLPQIIGRIRNAKVKNLVQLWYSPNKYYSHTTTEEFEASVKKALSGAYDVAKDYEVVSPSGKIAFQVAAHSDPYLRVVEVEGKVALKVNETAYYNEMHSFESIQRTYYVASSESKDCDQTIRVNGIDHNYIVTDKVKIKGLNKARVGKVPNFRTLCEEYHKAQTMGVDNEVREIGLINTLIPKAYTQIGFDKMRALKFIQKDIEREVDLEDKTRSLDWKITKLLGYSVGQFISSSNIKTHLSKAYNELGIAKATKATLLDTLYETKIVQRTIDGKKMEGRVIINCKVKST
jgi:hypothetical protein